MSFPVPKRYLELVIQTLAKAMANDAAVPATAGNDPPVKANSPLEAALIDWTKAENCMKLRRALRADSAALAMLNLTAERYGTLVSYSEVVEASGRGRNGVRGDLVGLTKAIKRLFGVERNEAIWPVDYRWGAGGEPQAYYQMGQEISEAWRESAAM